MVQITECPTCGKVYMKNDMPAEFIRVSSWKRFKIFFWNTLHDYSKKKCTEIHEEPDLEPNRASDWDDPPNIFDDPDLFEPEIFEGLEEESVVLDDEQAVKLLEQHMEEKEKCQIKTDQKR